MPGSYMIDVPNRLVVTQAWATVNDAELLAHAKQLGADPRFLPDFRQIADFSHVGEARVTREALRELGRINPWGAGAHRAVITPQDLLFGMARMYELMSDQRPEEFRIFRDIPTAVAWLGLPADWPLPPRDRADAFFEFAARA